MLLDGHVRLTILKATGQAESAKCLVATDDEGFTYNHKVNRLSADPGALHDPAGDQERRQRGADRRTLNVDVGQHPPEARSAGRDLPGGGGAAAGQAGDRRALRELRKVKPMRQIEMAELMSPADNYSVGYANCLVAATPADQLVDPDRGRVIPGALPRGFDPDRKRDGVGGPGISVA